MTSTKILGEFQTGKVYAFATFSDYEDAVRAANNIDGKDFGGRNLVSYMTVKSEGYEPQPKGYEPPADDSEQQPKGYEPQKITLTRRRGGTSSSRVFNISSNSSSSNSGSCVSRN